MLAFLIYPLLHWSFFKGHFVSILSDSTSFAHAICVSKIANSPYKDLYSGIVCAEPLLHTPEVLNRLGLVHIFVVSGSHLLLIFALFKFLESRIFLPSWIQFLLLFSYVCVCNWDIPVLLAFSRFILRKMNSAKKLGWSYLTLELHSGLLTLCFCQSKWNLLSLSLSWTAGLSTSISTRTFKHDIEFKQQILIYLAMIPLLSFFATIHPITILSNLLIGTLLGLFLLPITGLLCWSSYTNFILDSIINHLFELLNTLSVPVLRPMTEINWALIASYPLILNGFLYLVWRFAK